MPFGVPSLAGATVGVSADPQAQVAVPQQPMSPIAQAMQSLPSQIQAKPKINWLGVLADALAGAAGRPGPYGAMLDQQRLFQQQEDAYQRRRADEFDMWQREQEYGATHPKALDPTPFGRELIESGLQPGTPEYQKRMSDHLSSVDDPLVTITLPGNRVYSGPRSGLVNALGGGGNPDTTPTVEDGYSYTPGPGGRANKSNWKPAGGPTQPASGTFR